MHTFKHLSIKLEVINTYNNKFDNLSLWNHRTALFKGKLVLHLPKWENVCSVHSLLNLRKLTINKKKIDNK